MGAVRTLTPSWRKCKVGAVWGIGWQHLERLNEKKKNKTDSPSDTEPLLLLYIPKEMENSTHKLAHKYL